MSTDGAHTWLHACYAKPKDAGPCRGLEFSAERRTSPVMRSWPSRSMLILPCSATQPARGPAPGTGPTPFDAIFAILRAASRFSHVMHVVGRPPAWHHSSEHAHDRHHCGQPHGSHGAGRSPLAHQVSLQLQVSHQSGHPPDEAEADDAAGFFQLGITTPNESPNSPSGPSSSKAAGSASKEMAQLEGNCRSVATIINHLKRDRIRLAASAAVPPRTVDESLNISEAAE